MRNNRLYKTISGKADFVKRFGCRSAEKSGKIGYGGVIDSLASPALNVI